MEEELEIQEEILEDFIYTEPTYNVYVQVDENNVITRVDSEWNISDTSEWILVEENVEEQRGHHAQSCYLEKGLFDELGHFNYKLVDGEVVELTDEEKEELFPPIEPQPSLEERMVSVEETQETHTTSIEELQEQNEMLVLQNEALEEMLDTFLSDTLPKMLNE